MAEMTNGLSGRGGGTILLARGSTMGTNGQLTVYNHLVGGGWGYQCLYPKLNPTMVII